MFLAVVCDIAEFVFLAVVCDIAEFECFLQLYGFAHQRYTENTILLAKYTQLYIVLLYCMCECKLYTACVHIVLYMYIHRLRRDMLFTWRGTERYWMYCQTATTSSTERDRSNTR